MRLPADADPATRSARSDVPNVVADSDDEADPASSCEFPQVRCDAAVEVELGLCQALSSWDPWVTPTQHLVENLRAVKAATSASDRDAARVCLLRQQVIHQLQYEADHFAGIPERFKYNAVARWRLRCDHVYTTCRRRTSIRQSIEGEYIQNAHSLTLDTIADRIETPCGIHKRVHYCLDVFDQILMPC